MISDLNIKVDPERCLACGNCVDRCIMDNLRLAIGPCRQACPLQINCQGYLRLLAKGREEDAAAHLRQDTPFGEVLGYICNHPCESACQRHTGCHDGAVHIRAIKRYLSERFPAVVAAPAQKAPATGKRAAVVGAGPAGLMAAYELAAAGHDVTLFDAGDKPGGLLRTGIPAFRLPDAVTDRAVAQVTALGVRIESEKRLGADLSLDALEQEYDAVLLALGLGRSLSPRIPGADLPAVHGALEVLHKARKGERFDAASAIVIGGGSTAMDVALSLKKMGLDVTMLVMEGPYDMPIPEGERDEALEEGVRIENRWGVTAIRAGQDGLTCTMQRCLAVFDHNGAFAPELDPLCTAERSADMVVLAIGQGLDPVDGLPQTARHLLDADPQTGRLAGRDKVFAAGDCTTGASSVVAAMASGRSVARCVSRFLCEEYPLTLDEMAEKGWCNDFEPHLERSNGVPRGSLTRLPVAERSLTAVTEQVLTPEEAQKEAARCMACGRAFEANRTCWFCLPCEIDCPEEALTVRMPYLVR